MEIEKPHLRDYIVNYYYIIVMILYYFSIQYPFLRVGFLASILMGVIFILNIKSIIFCKKIFDLFIIIYVLYNLVTGLFYLINDLPPTVFFKELSNSIFPVVFYFAGKRNFEKFSRNSFFRTFNVSVFFCLIVGFYYYFYPSENYINYLSRTIAYFFPEIYFANIRLNSFVGSTALGSLSVIAVVFAVYCIMCEGISAKYLILYLVSSLGAVLTMQRSAIVMLALMIIACHLYGIYTRRLKFRFLIIEILVVFSVLMLIPKNTSGFKETIALRMSSITDAVSERSDSWFDTIKHTDNLILGSGLGSVGHKAMEYATHFVRDGNYFKILAETGYVGLILFINIIVITFIRFIKYNKKYFYEFSVIFILLVQAIGSNVLAFQILLPIFWYCIGRIWSEVSNVIEYQPCVENGRELSYEN